MKILRCTAAILVLLHLSTGVAWADCKSLQKAVSILAVDLSKQEGDIKKGEKEVEKLNSDMQQAAGDALATLRQQKNKAERELELERQKHAETVKKLASKGQKINEGSCLNGG